jgi:UDP-N-acetylmuramyl pentapeptide phosphotransferase/UDP-N-acetylglucosamine-1-phosphate transferase
VASTLAAQAISAAVATAAVLAILAQVTPASFLANALRDGAPRKPVRQLGGLAILPAALLALAMTGETNSLVARFWPVGGALILWLLGIVDDRYHLPALPKLAVQIAAAAMAANAVAPEIGFGVLPRPLETLVIAAILVGFINMTNFMDGMDLMTIAGIGIPLAGLSIILLSAGQSGIEIQLGLLTAAALAGFLPFNWPPARLYLGDSGSLAIGLVAGLVAMRAFSFGPAVALAPFGYYLADAATTLVARIRDRENVLQPHTRHAYQAAMKAGRSPLWIAARVAVANLALLVLAAIAQIIPGAAVEAVAIVAAAAIGIAMLRVLRRQPW